VQGAGGLAELGGELSGGAGLGRTLSGEGNLLDVLDTLGLAADFATPGIPLIAGLGIADSVARLAGKLPSGGAVDDVYSRAYDMLQAINKGESVVAPGTTKLGGEDVPINRTLIPATTRDDMSEGLFGSAKEVSIEVPRGTAGFDDGLKIVASRDFHDPTVVNVQSVFDLDGRELTDTFNPRSMELRSILGQEFPGVETVKASRTLKPQSRKELLEAGEDTLLDLESMRAEGFDPPDLNPYDPEDVAEATRFAETYSIGEGREMNLNVTKRGERALQAANPLQDFITTVLSNPQLSTMGSPTDAASQLRRLLRDLF
jgi:hypothetical protein